MQGEWSTPEGQQVDKPVHIYPLNDLREHIIDGLWCPCMPRLIPPEPEIIDGQRCQRDHSAARILHNSYDGRELREVVTRALDSMGKALADHGHQWSADMRRDYEQSIDLLNLHLQR